MPPNIIPQKWAQHLVMLRRYGTPRKIRNLARALRHYGASTPHVETYPSFLKVEVSNRCEVGCKYCYAGKSGRLYPLPEFKRLVDELAPFLLEVSLHDIGEPLWHEQLPDFVRHAHSRKVGTIFSTTLSVEKGDDFWADIVDSGLDRIIVAVDGIEPATYNAYRTRGRLPLVWENLERLMVLRRRARSRLLVTWQMIDLPWNRGEQDRAARMARRLGCDDFAIIREDTLERRAYFEDSKPRRRQCLMPFLMFIVNASNLVRPCCNLYRGISPGIDQENLVGDLGVDSFADIWNSEAMQVIRDRKRIAQREYCRNCREM